MDMTDVEIGRRIREAREAAGWTIKAMSTAAGIDGSSWSRTETGFRALKARELVAVSRALGVPLDSIIGGSQAEFDAAVRTAKALRDPVIEATADWLTAMSHAAGLFHQESDGAFAEAPALALASILEDPPHRDVVIEDGTQDVVEMALRDLTKTFRFSVLPPPDNDNEEDTDNGR